MGISFSADDRACTIVGPDGQRIRILFGKPTRDMWGKTRFRLNEAGPMHLKEAFLGGDAKNVIITVVPEGWVPTPTEAQEASVETEEKLPRVAHVRKEFKKLLPTWLAQSGSCELAEIYDTALTARPDLCDATWPCPSCEGEEPAWRHQIRWALDELEKEKVLEREGNTWRVPEPIL